MGLKKTLIISNWNYKVIVFSNVAALIFRGITSWELSLCDDKKSKFDLKSHDHFWYM